MFKGFFTAASGMIAQQRRTEMLTNNMANANTPGFKADQSSVRAFPEMLLDRIGSKSIPTEKGLHLPIHSRVGSLNTGVYMQEAAPEFLQGDIQQTQRNTDIALVDGSMPSGQEKDLKGTVLFTALNAAGELRYTRNGNFTIDEQGFLTTPLGYYILDENNKRIQLNSENFTVDENGMIMENNRSVARIGIGFSDNPYTLLKEGDGLFRKAGEPLINAYNERDVSFKLQQGFIEGSNIDSSRTMTDMMSAYRSFEANQKVLQAYDRSMEKAVNEIGRIG
ncbi:flagellar hook-basal body protein [Peribacillus cavernae]|uniref:Flagellar hook-basal body protein n=1 Tax=Peribacillus cavernae TaxID=1674310 RepID=A0A3S0VG70_9BACI|nr:flagellar hook-basal body protein [Peribacillus cavernae]MDQ0218482.1 flagellar basal-body rod protein FlgG [Peribacillus cavernae]RUQ31477.1 flagellar hook-basal body protein [Peribacillus cavernae]